MKIHSTEPSYSIRTDRQTRTDKYNGANSDFSASAKAPKKTKVLCHLFENLTSKKNVVSNLWAQSRLDVSISHCLTAQFQ
jgi:hypothetical protein